MGTTTSRGYRKPASGDNFIPHTDIGNLADDVNTDMEATWGAAWTDFSASLVITGGTTNPTKGNSTYSARYRYTAKNSVLYVVRCVFGSTWNAGSGVYSFNMPVTPADSEGYGAMGTMHFFDTSASTEYIGAARITVSKVYLYLNKQDGTTTANHTIPGTQLTGGAPVSNSDAIRFSIEYEV